MTPETIYTHYTSADGITFTIITRQNHNGHWWSVVTSEDPGTPFRRDAGRFVSTPNAAIALARRAIERWFA